MNIHTIDIEIPKSLTDERLDLMLLKLDEISQNKGCIVNFSLEKNEEISCAGYAVLMVLLDAVSEHKHKAKTSHVNVDKPIHLKLEDLASKSTDGFMMMDDMNYIANDEIIIGKVSSIAPEFIQMLEHKFLKILGEENLWSIKLIANELMQNTVDHSTSERYFVYAGVMGDDFGIGVLDRGVSIPSKLESKYFENLDQEYLEKSLEIHIGTRRNRAGGIGLYYLFENIKKVGGKLVLISRNGQIRRHFSSRNVVKGKTKVPLRGTWCMARIPLEKK